MKNLNPVVLTVLLFSIEANNSFGQTWSLVSSGVKNNLTQMAFPDSRIGYVIADCPHDSNASAFILKTTDGGLHWTSVLTRKGRTFKGIDFLTADTGVVIGDGGNDSCFKTFDGGKNWIGLLMPRDVGALVHMLTANEWVYVRSQNWGRTIDGGRTWIDSTRGNAGILPLITSDLHFANKVTAFLFGGYGTPLIRSNDGGKSWLTALNVPTSTTISSGCFSSISSGVCAVNTRAAKLYKTVDGAQNWVTSDSLSDKVINCVRNLGPNLFYAVGKNGFITKSIDAGTSWTSEMSGTNQHLNKVAVLQDRAVSIGDSGTIVVNLSLPAVVSANSSEPERLMIYPNPASTSLIIEGRLTEFRRLRLEIFDMGGRVVLSSQLCGQFAIVNIANLPANEYLFRILTNDRIIKTGRFNKLPL